MSTPKIPWLRISLEGLVIVASVLLALAADAWWDGRKQRQEEITILNGLRADLNATLQVIDGSRSASRGVVSATTQLLMLTGPGTPAVSAAKVDTLLAEAISGSPFEPVDATLTVLLNAEGLGIINSAELRAALAEWPPRMERIRRPREQVADAVLDYFLPYLQERIPLQALDAIEVPSTPPSGFQHDSRQLLSELRFENGLSDILYYHRQLVSRLDDLQGYVEATLALLEAELSTL